MHYIPLLKPLYASTSVCRPHLSAIHPSTLSRQYHRRGERPCISVITNPSCLFLSIPGLSSPFVFAFKPSALNWKFIVSGFLYFLVFVNTKLAQIDLTAKISLSRHSGIFESAKPSVYKHCTIACSICFDCLDIPEGALKRMCNCTYWLLIGPIQRSDLVLLRRVIIFTLFKTQGALEIREQIPWLYERGHANKCK